VVRHKRLHPRDTEALPITVLHYTTKVLPASKGECPQDTKSRAPPPSPGRDPAGAGSAAGLRGRRRGDGAAPRSAGGRREQRRRPSPAATRRKAMAFLCSSDELGFLCPWNAQNASRRRPHGREGEAGRRRRRYRGCAKEGGSTGDGEAMRLPLQLLETTKTIPYSDYCRRKANCICLSNLPLNC